MIPENEAGEPMTPEWFEKRREEANAKAMEMHQRSGVPLVRIPRPSGAQGGIHEEKTVSVDRPWLLPSVIQWLEGLLLKHWTVLETGAGGSTVFFAERVKRVISFDNDLAWITKVADQLNGRNLQGSVIQQYVPGYPTAGLELQLLPVGMLPFDLAFIDGRGRVRSVLDALPALRSGGWLVLDDAGRDRYSEARRVMDNACAERIEFRSPPWQPEQWTTAWRKR